MEFCEGGEFQYFLDNNATLAESELKIYLAQMVTFIFDSFDPFLLIYQVWGLNELHTKYNMIHRDIKPDNCLIDEAGMITIIDFGVAEKLDENGLDIIIIIIRIDNFQ
jgi:serine/threonine protein kinase